MINRRDVWSMIWLSIKIVLLLVFIVTGDAIVVLYQNF